MKYTSVIILCFCLCEILCLSLDKKDSISLLKGNSSSEQKVWNIKLDIYFSKTLPSVITRSRGNDVRFKCEAIMNYTKVEKYTKNKEGIETLLTETPPDHIQETLLRNLKVYWLKDNKTVTESHKYKTTTKIDKTNGTISTNLKVKDLENTDKGNYTCTIKQNFERKQTTRLIVEDEDNIENYEIPTYTSLFPNAFINNQLEIDVKTTPDLMSENIKSQGVGVSKVKNSTKPRKLEAICQEYVGKECEAHLKGQFVYIPHHKTQAGLEEKLKQALQVTRFSNDISSHCEGYAIPSLCYSTFPICRNPFETNNNFFIEAKAIFSTNKESESKDLPEIVFENGIFPPMYAESNDSVNPFDYRHNSTILRRVCKQDCEILENELCQKEYAIAKRHPHIGQQLTLEECQDLPLNDPECLKINIGAVMVSDDECYWENGSGYLGRVNVAENGEHCIEWSKQWHVKVFDYPELAGSHSYCRNPGGVKPQPWCVIDKEGKSEKQLCDIPKCAHKIWIYIVIVFLLVMLIIVAFIICLCYKHKNKNNASTIRDINLPNADKNIYGNSRLNSPIEMSDLLNNSNMNNQLHFTQSSRANSVLQVPQYSLSQIKFLEELGEGAFGKVYKGALKSNGDKQYVAVKALKENASAKTKADFRREIDLISELTHDNIVCIVGVALREEPLCMLFEYMAQGDLHDFLIGRAPPSGKGLPPLRLLNFAYNVAAGMQYLASNHYVHRDLAARNCLVSADLVVKISDFGLSRDIYSSDYYRVQSKSLLPVRWMPPESILYGKFTSESDIWSYGVVLWEIYTYGLQPYYGYCNQEVISMVRSGDLLGTPAGCPEPVDALMRECWHHTPQRRPNFDGIVERLQEWIDACPDAVPSESGSSGCGHRPSCSSRELQERVPLLPPHCSSSNGSLATGSSKKFSSAGSTSKVTDDNRSTCSEVPPHVKSKKLSCTSLVDDKSGTKETVVRIQNTQYGNEI